MYMAKKKFIINKRPMYMSIEEAVKINRKFALDILCFIESSIDCKSRLRHGL